MGSARGVRHAGRRADRLPALPQPGGHRGGDGARGRPADRLGVLRAGRRRPPAPGRRLGGPDGPAGGGRLHRRGLGGGGGGGGGVSREATGRPEAEGSPLPIVLGSVLDGIPESYVLGLTVLQGGVSLALLVAVVLSNLPEGMSSSSGLKAAGWPRGRVVAMWSAVVVVSALASAAGYATLGPASGPTGGLVEAFAGGALLAMLANSLLPEAYDVEGVFTGPLVVVGFAVSLALSA